MKGDEEGGGVKSPWERSIEVIDGNEWIGSFIGGDSGRGVREARQYSGVIGMYGGELVW